MPQAAIPDINVAIIAYRSRLFNAIDNGDFFSVRMAIEAINGLLADDLKLTFVPQAYYNSLILPGLFVVCSCSAEIPVNEQTIKKHNTKYSSNDIKYLHINLSELEYVICPECQNSIYYNLQKWRNSLKYKKKNQFDDVPYLPEPPEVDSFEDRVYNSNKFLIWIKTVIPVLEDRIRQFRNMYSIQNDDDIDVVKGAE